MTDRYSPLVVVSFFFSFIFSSIYFLVQTVNVAANFTSPFVQFEQGNVLIILGIDIDLIGLCFYLGLGYGYISSGISSI